MGFLVYSSFLPLIEHLHVESIGSSKISQCESVNGCLSLSLGLNLSPASLTVTGKVSKDGGWEKKIGKWTEFMYSLYNYIAYTVLSSP